VVFDRNSHGVQFGKPDLHINREKSSASIGLPYPVVSMRRCDALHQPQQGDELWIAEEEARFRVLDVSFAMDGMVRVTLEQLGRA
jgi:hypothetical protein